MISDVDLMQQAAAGSAAAQLGLVDLAMAAGASGAIRQVECLIAAETWARMAASAGGVNAHRALAGVLLTRADFEAARSNAYSARWYEDEARRVLLLLIALDDEDARRALDELGESSDRDHHGPDVALLANLAAAARGDLVALGSLYDEAVRLLAAGQGDPIEALTAAELYARIGATIGDADHLRRLAGTLLKRAEYESRAGRPAIGRNAVTEAATILSILVDTGDQSMAPWLIMLANDSNRPAVMEAARDRPTILKFIEPEGNC